MLDNAIKLKLQELIHVAKGVDCKPTLPAIMTFGQNSVLRLVDQLVKMLPPEVTEGIIENVQETQRAFIGKADSAD